MFESLVEFVRDTYRTREFIPLHAPTFAGREREYVNETLESTFVSSVGGFVDRFEEDIQQYTGTARAVATVNGTAALHTALYLAGVKTGDLVITQALTFVATCPPLLRFHMCTLIILRRPGHSWPTLIAANRDEMVSRPWRPPARHWPDRPDTVAGIGLPSTSLLDGSGSP